MINYKEGKMLQLGTGRASNLAVWHLDLEHVGLFAKYTNCQISIFLRHRYFLLWDVKRFGTSEV